MILYCPCASVVADRTRSMSAGLAASTVTPGSTPPVASLMMPAIALWARATVGANTRHSAPTTIGLTSRLIFITASHAYSRMGGAPQIGEGDLCLPFGE